MINIQKVKACSPWTTCFKIKEAINITLEGKIKIKSLENVCSSEIYLYGKICDFLMFTAVTYNKVGFFDVYICIYIYEKKDFSGSVNQKMKKKSLCHMKIVGIY